MSVFELEIDRSGCPSRYIFHDVVCCRVNSPEYGHFACSKVKDFRCYWALNGKIERLEKVVEELIKCD